MEGIPGVLSELYRVIQEKRENGGEKSYTKYLFTSGQDKISGLAELFRDKEFGWSDDWSEED